MPHFIRLYSIVALLVLAGGVALDASFLARFQQRYPYGAPVHAGDLAAILSGFRPADLQSYVWSLPAIVIALAVLTVLANWFSSRIAAPIRFALSLFQLPIVLVGGVGALVFLSTVCDAFRGQLDGEWLHNGTPLLGALGVWAPVPAIVFTTSLTDRKDAVSHGP